MVGPARKSEAVKHVQDRLGMSECRLDRGDPAYCQTGTTSGLSERGEVSEAGGLECEHQPNAPALEAGGAQSSSQGGKEESLWQLGKWSAEGARETGGSRWPVA